jgi:hypothetical protein
MKTNDELTQIVEWLKAHQENRSLPFMFRAFLQVVYDLKTIPGEGGDCLFR